MKRDQKVRFKSGPSPRPDSWGSLKEDLQSRNDTRSWFAFKQKAHLKHNMAAVIWALVVYLILVYFRHSKTIKKEE